MIHSSQVSSRVRREAKFIASVYPGAPPAVDRPFDGWTTYRIDACPKGEKPKLLEVKDCFQFSIDVMNRNVMNESIIWHDQVITDLLKHWAATPIGAPAGSGPGIGVIEGLLPTPEEIERLMARQEVLFDWLYHEGMRLSQAHEWRDINRHHRMACEWLGLEEPWARDTRKATSIPCPACTVPISTSAYICPSCGTTVRALPEELMALQPGSLKKKAA